MARFSFPVPSRRQRGAQAQAQTQAPINTPSTATASQNRVRKVPSLSSSQAGAWPGHLAQEPPRNWETQSNSCISITVTDSTISRGEHDAGASALPAGHQGLSSLTEGYVVNSTTTLRQPTYDAESGVLGNMHHMHREPFHGAGGADGSLVLHNDRRSVTDASSLRRKQSSSTIVSYYDKSKVPLAISQQTSSSAMAKGLPSKAKSLLDIDGSLANDASKKKKRKPVGLDLSRVFAHRKGTGSTNSLSVEPDRTAAQGLSAPKRSPSLLAAARLERLDRLARPRSGQRSHSDQDSRPTTRGSLRGKRSKAAAGATSTTYRNGVQPAAMFDSGAGLEHLYSHYEQRTMRDIPAQTDASSDAEAEVEDDEATPEPTPLNSRPPVPSDAKANSAHAPARSEPARSDTDRYNRPLHKADAGAANARHARPPHAAQRDGDGGVLPYYKGNAPYVGGTESVDSRLAKSTTERGGLPALQLPSDVDCADSISSRHTRTSKASRRTSQSLVDSDLKQISMLSLSSDSEEDDMEDILSNTAHGLGASASVLLSPNDTETDTETAFGGSPGPYGPWTSLGLPAGPKVGNPGQVHLNGNSQKRFMDQPYSSTHHYVRPSISSTNQRISSSSLLTASTSKPSSGGNRDSLTVQSPTQSSRRSFASTHTTDSINISSYTVHEARAITMVPAQGASYRSAELAPGPIPPSEIGTPPLSPTSMDFLVHATHPSALDCEQGSIPSAGSSLRGSVYNLGSTGPAKWTGQGQVLPGNGRLMAVTRQEELLLAALRKKRLRMRESIIAEFGEGLEKESDAPSTRQGSMDAATMGGLRQPRPPSAGTDEPMHFSDTIAFPRPPSSASTTSFGPPYGPLPASPPMQRWPSSSAKRSSSGLPLPSYTAPELLGDFDGSELSSRMSDRLDVDSRLDGSGGVGGSGEGGDQTSTRRHSTDSFGIPGGLPAPTKRRYQPRLLAAPPSAPNNGRRRPSGGMQGSSTGLGVPGGLLLQPGAAATAPWQSRSPVDECPVQIVDEPTTDMEMPADDEQYDGGLVDKRPATDDGTGAGIPRPDSPVESGLPLPRRRAVRISAVGPAGMMGGNW